MQQSFSGGLRSAEYVAAVELGVTPAYQLGERIEYWSLGEVLERWHEEMKDRRHFSFFWGPQPRSLALYGLADSAGSSLDCYVKRYDELPLDAERSSRPARRVGPAHLIYLASLVG
jgi:hypothetical protein